MGLAHELGRYFHLARAGVGCLWLLTMCGVAGVFWFVYWWNGHDGLSRGSIYLLLFTVLCAGGVILTSMMLPVFLGLARAWGILTPK